MSELKKQRLILALLAACFTLFFVNCGDEDSSANSTVAVGDPDASDDDVDDDVEVFVHCGYLLQSDVLLSQDLDCSASSEPAIVLNASGITLDCGGYTIIGPVVGEIPAVKAEGVSDVAVINCVLVAGENGVDFRNVSEARVINNDISNPRRFGIMFDDVEEFEIDGNIVFSTGGVALNGLEIGDSKSGLVTGNEIDGFLWSGIAAYITSDVEILGNTVSNVDDTGIGFFGSGYLSGGCFDIEVSGNDVSGAQNVGAVEIMHGSHHLSFIGNNFHDCRQAFYVYDDSGVENHDISIVGNEFLDNGAGINVASGAYNIEVLENEFSNIAAPLTFRVVSDVTITGNTIENDVLETEFALRFSEVKNLKFNNNVLINCERYVEASTYEEIDLRWNYWAGCPYLIWFHLDDDPLTVINPLNSLPCSYVDQAIDIVDEDADGYDDEDCVREFPIECVEP